MRYLQLFVMFFLISGSFSTLLSMKRLLKERYSQPSEQPPQKQQPQKKSKSSLSPTALPSETSLLNRLPAIPQESLLFEIVDIPLFEPNKQEDHECRFFGDKIGVRTCRKRFKNIQRDEEIKHITAFHGIVISTECFYYSKDEDTKNEVLELLRNCRERSS